MSAAGGEGASSPRTVRPTARLVAPRSIDRDEAAGREVVRDNAGRAEPYRVAVRDELACERIGQGLDRAQRLREAWNQTMRPIPDDAVVSLV